MKQSGEVSFRQIDGIFFLGFIIFILRKMNERMNEFETISFTHNTSISKRVG